MSTTPKLNLHTVSLLQETWLAKQNQDTLATISDDFNWYGISNVDYGQGPIAGRPSGGTAILWNKLLSASFFSNANSSIIGVKVMLSQTNFLSIINVYLPYCCNENTDRYIQYLSDLETMCCNQNNPNISIVGDFNAGPSNSFYNH